MPQQSAIDVAYLRGINPDQLRRDLLNRVRSSPLRVIRDTDNRVNQAWYEGRPWFYRQPGWSTKIIGLNPQKRGNFLYPNILRDIIRTMSGVMFYVPDVEAAPTTSDPADLVRAETDQHIARHLIESGNLQRGYSRVVEMCNLYYDGFIKVVWDPDAGMRVPQFNTTPCPVCTDTELQQAPGGLIFRGAGPDSPGAIWTDQGLQSCFNCSAQGFVGAQPGVIEEFVGHEPEGNVSFEVVLPEDVYIDPEAPTFEDAEECIHRIRMSPERAWSRYGRAAGIPQEAFEKLPSDAWDLPLAFQVREGRPGDARYIAVTEYYKRPDEKHPEGIFAVSVNDRTIFAGPIPQLHDRKWNPLFRFTMYDVDGKLYGQSTADIALPLCLAVADLVSAGQFRAKESARMRLLVPDSTGVRMNTDTGNIHYKDRPSSPKPEPMTLGTVPPDVAEMRDLLLGMLDRISGATDVLRGATGGIESGIGMSFAEERALTPLRPIMAKHAVVLEQVIRYALELAKSYYSDGRQIRLTGINGATQVREFRVEDSGSGSDVRLRAIKDAGRSRAARMQELNDAADRQILTPEEYKKLAEFGDIDAFYRERQPHVNMAVQEHQTLYRTGMIQSPLPTENHTIHMDEHAKEINAIKSRDPNSQLIPIMLAHYDAHMQLQAERDVKSQIYQQMAMQQIGQANAANLAFQPAATQQQLAQGAGGPSSSPAGSPPSSEPFPNQPSGLGEQASLGAAQMNLQGE